MKKSITFVAYTKDWVELFVEVFKAAKAELRFARTDSAKALSLENSTVYVIDTYIAGLEQTATELAKTHHVVAFTGSPPADKQLQFVSMAEVKELQEVVGRLLEQ